MIHEPTVSHDHSRIGDKVRIVQRGKRKIWTAEFWQGGEHRRRSLKTSNIKIARTRAQILEGKLAAGEYAPPPKAITIASSIEQFMTSMKANAKARKTIVKYQGELGTFRGFSAQRGAVMLNHITPALFEEYLAYRRKTHAEKTIYTGAIIIKGFVKWAVDRSMLGRNPLKVCRLTKPYVAPKKVPSAAQIDQILQSAGGNRQVQYAVLAYSGIRAGELQMLRPQDVDLEAGWIRIVGRDDWMPKTRKARTIPIHPKLAQYLQKVPTTAGPFFFCAAPSRKYPNGDHFINMKHLNEDFQKLANFLGMPIGRKNDGFVIHSLRHFFETIAVNSGVPQFIIDAWMGHTDNASMGKVYFGLSDEKSQDSMREVKF